MLGCRRMSAVQDALTCRHLHHSCSAWPGADQGIGERVGAHAEAMHQQRAQRGRGCKCAHVGDHDINLRRAQALPQRTLVSAGPNIVQMPIKAAYRRPVNTK